MTSQTSSNRIAQLGAASRSRAIHPTAPPPQAKFTDQPPLQTEGSHAKWLTEKYENS